MGSEDKAAAVIGAKRRLASYALLVVLGGLVLSSMLSWSHVTRQLPRFCELSEHVNCGRVLQSAWASLFNMPLAFYGVAYFLIGLTLCLYLAGPRTDDREVAAGLFVYALVGVASVVYFVYAEIMVGALCLTCTGVHVLCLVLVPLSWKILKLRHPTWSLTPMSVARLAVDLNAWVLLALLLVGTPLIAINVMMVPDAMYTPESLKAFGQCLNKRQATLLTMPGCQYCKKQKDDLGPGVEHLKVIECVEGDGQPECAGVHAFPYWHFKSNSAYVKDRTKGGYVSLSELSRLSRCPMPTPAA